MRNNRALRPLPFSRRRGGAGAFAWLALAVFFFFPALADAPLPDAAQEARAQALFLDLRCVVCQGQSIADSPAGVAQDIRAAVRERLQAGQSDEEIRQALVSRYGEFVLMTPPFKPQTYLLWFSPLVLLMLGSAVVFAYFYSARLVKK